VSLRRQVGSALLLGLSAFFQPACCSGSWWQLRGSSIRFFLPKPRRRCGCGAEQAQEGILVNDAWRAIGRVLGGYALSILVSVGRCGIANGSNRLVCSLLEPLLV